MVALQSSEAVASECVPSRFQPTSRIGSRAACSSSRRARGLWPILCSKVSTQRWTRTQKANGAKKFAFGHLGGQVLGANIKRLHNRRVRKQVLLQVLQGAADTNIGLMTCDRSHNARL